MWSQLLSRYWLLVPLLVLVIVVRDWAEDTPATLADQDTLDMQATESDYYLENFRTRKFDATGRLEYIITGDTLQHNPDNDQSELTAPEVELFRETANWTISSKQGLYDTDPDVFTLQGDVQAIRSNSRDGGLSIRTNDLSVSVDNNEVSTTDAIEIIAPAWQLRAVGLQSSLDEGKLDLLSQVHGHYDPPVPESTTDEGSSR